MSIESDHALPGSRHSNTPLAFLAMFDVTAGKRAKQLLDSRSSGTMKATKITIMLVFAGMVVSAAANGEQLPRPA